MLKEESPIRSAFMRVLQASTPKRTKKPWASCQMLSIVGHWLLARIPWPPNKLCSRPGRRTISWLWWLWHLTSA